MRGCSAEAGSAIARTRPERSAACASHLPRKRGDASAHSQATFPDTRCALTPRQGSDAGASERESEVDVAFEMRDGGLAFLQLHEGRSVHGKASGDQTEDQAALHVRRLFPPGRDTELSADHLEPHRERSLRQKGRIAGTEFRVQTFRRQADAVVTPPTDRKRGKSSVTPRRSRRASAVMARGTGAWHRPCDVRARAVTGSRAHRMSRLDANFEFRRPASRRRPRSRS